MIANSATTKKNGGKKKKEKKYWDRPKFNFMRK
jgi:hypothetical protein